MKDLFWGGLIIGIGLVSQRSVFLGDFSWWNVLFDALGTYWLVKGLVALARRRSGAPTASESAATAAAPADVPAGVAQAARAILAEMKRNFAAPVPLRPAQASRFQHLDLARYDAYQAAMERRGFRCLGDFDTPTVNDSPTTLLAPTFLRICVSEDGQLVVAYFQVQPRLGRLVRQLFTGLLNLRWVDAPRHFRDNLRMKQCADVETELDDGTFLVTSNAQTASLLAQPPGILIDFLPQGTPLPALLDRHRAQLARTLHGGVRKPVPVRTVDDMLAVQMRMAAYKVAWRESVQWVTRDEVRAMAGNNRDFADAVHAEVQRLVAAERSAA